MNGTDDGIYEELIGQRMQVHFNLHTHVWSVTALTGPRRQRVIACASDITLTNATFKVSEAGHRRAKRDRQRNVHAWVTGIVTEVDTSPDLSQLLCVTYQPKPRDPELDPYFRVRTAGRGPIVEFAAVVVCAKTSPDAVHGYAWIAPKALSHAGLPAANQPLIALLRPVPRPSHTGVDHRMSHTSATLFHAPGGSAW